MDQNSAVNSEAIRIKRNNNYVLRLYEIKII